MVDENSKTPNGDDQELNSETVMIAIIGGSELDVDQIDSGVRTADVDHLGKQHRTITNCRHSTEITGST